MINVAAVSRRQAEQTEQKHREHQHDLAPEPVGQRAGTQRAEYHADQRSAHHRAQAGPVDAPVLAERWCNEAHCGGIEAIEKHDQKTQRNHPPLIPGQRLRIDEGLNVERTRHRPAGGKRHGDVLLFL